MDGLEWSRENFAGVRSGAADAGAEDAGVEGIDDEDRHVNSKGVDCVKIDRVLGVEAGE